MLDLSAVKQRQRATWATGDFHTIGVGHVIVGERLYEYVNAISVKR